MSKALNHIKITLIPQNVKNKDDDSKDEKIYITPLSGYNFEVKHHIPPSHGVKKSEYTTLRITESSVNHYIKCLIHALFIDEMPCESIQLDFPAIPSIMLSLNYIKNHKEKVLDTIRDLCHLTEDSWFNDPHYESGSDSGSSDSESSDSDSSSSDSEEDEGNDCCNCYEEDDEPSETNDSSSAASEASDHTPIHRARLTRTIYNTRSRTRGGRHHLFFNEDDE